jgi:hypothetical protein
MDSNTIKLLVLPSRDRTKICVNLRISSLEYISRRPHNSKVTMCKFTFVLVVCVGLGFARADIIDFEDLPNTNIADFCGGGGTNIGNFYAGVGVANIGADVFGLNTACGVSGYPPNSGDINVFSGDDFAIITFNSLVSAVSVNYVALDPIVLTAYDSGNNVLGSTTGTANTDGTTGFNSLLSVSFPNTSSVTLGNTGLADEYVFDDLSFTQQSAIPEPASWPLLALGTLFLWRRVRRTAGTNSCRRSEL